MFHHSYRSTLNEIGTRISWPIPSAFVFASLQIPVKSVTAIHTNSLIQRDMLLCHTYQYIPCPFRFAPFCTPSHIFTPGSSWSRWHCLALLGTAWHCLALHLSSLCCCRPVLVHLFHSLTAMEIAIKTMSGKTVVLQAALFFLFPEW